MSHRKVLILDDDPYSRTFAADLLRQFGYEVETFNSLEGTRRRLLESSFGTLLLDHALSGIGMLNWLRDNNRNERVIMLSEDADYELLIDLVNHGAADLLPKPVQPLQLKRALELAETQAVA